MIGHGARETTNLARLLKFRSLVVLRLSSVFVAYFLLSVCGCASTPCLHTDILRTAVLLLTQSSLSI